MRIFNLTHYDLDGVVSSIIIKNYYPKNFIATATGYQEMDKTINNLIASIDNYSPESFVVLITDLNLSIEMLKKFEVLKKNPNAIRIIFIDHHENRPENKGATFKEAFVNDPFFLIFTELDTCGSLLTYRLFSGKNKKENLESLINYTNIYDLWKTENAFFLEYGLPLNNLFWKYGFIGFQTKFKDGFFGFDNEDKRILKFVENERNTYTKETEEYYLKEYEFPNGDSLAVILNPAGKYLAELEFFLTKKYTYYMMLKKPVNNITSFSFRIRNDKTIQELEQTISKQFSEKFWSNVNFAGHAKAGGIVIKDIFFQLNEEFVENFYEGINRSYK